MSSESEATAVPAIATEPTPTPVVGDERPTAAPTEPVAAPTASKEAVAAPGTPLTQFFAELPAIIKEADHSEMWGVELKDGAHVPTTIVLEKFLRANSKDVTKAKAQLLKALIWRNNMRPINLLAETEFDGAKFGGLGYVTIYEKADGKGKEIVTWNIYGGVKDIKVTFGNLEEFIKWRSALMELSVKQLDLPSATEKIPEDGEDQYRMLQVHDYLNVSFLRSPPEVKTASKEVIQVFAMAYPELVKEKFFVNVPVLMGWMFAAMKLFLSPTTVKKFHPLSYGSSLASELPEIGPELPEVYGGKGKDVTEGLTVKYAAGGETATKAVAA